MNDDENVNASDALFILQHSVGLIDQMSAEAAKRKIGDPSPNLENMIRVTDVPYNAAGDGKTNDRPAIQAASMQPTKQAVVPSA